MAKTRELKDVEVEMRNGCVFITRCYTNGDFSSYTVTEEAFEAGVNDMPNHASVTEEEINKRLYPKTA